jgi:sterol desaturase/sphingolipid hydroxylase (fatty acid hydroxylase superfamily)
MSQQGFNAIALAIPVFFLLIGLELWVERRERRLDSGRKLYRLNDTINDLACGTIQQLAGVFGKTVLFAGYILIFERFRVATLDSGNWAHWAIAFLGIDFFYYWFHRASHEVNLLWAAHIVHHQSEEYNLSVALRQSAVQQFFSAPFYWPLALLGVPPKVFLLVEAFDTLYQFWIHTRTIGKLGPLEAVLNTPSHHRVHHGSNAKYIDRNHGGTLIVWDRLFGTFQREEEEPAYGVTRPLASWNPLWANVQYYAELFTVARRAARWRDKLLVFVKPPGWRPADVPFEPVPYSPVQRLKYDGRAPAGLNLWAVVHFLLGLGAAIAVLFLEPRLSGAQTGAVALFAVWSLLDSGAAFDRSRWLPTSAVLRWSTALVALPFLLPAPWNLVAASFAAIGGVVSALLLRAHRKLLVAPAGASLPLTSG